MRGAPLIGVAAALAVAAEARRSDPSRVRKDTSRAIDSLGSARPTAVNLGWAMSRMSRLLQSTDDDSAAAALEREALAIFDEDRAACDRIAGAGLALIPDGATILTICNTGFLATGGTGTALAIVYRAQSVGRVKRVYVPETRPLLQGGRLTAWELASAGVPFKLIADGAIGAALRSGVDLAIIGADRIAANGDTANKIGSLPLALACKRFRIPLYVAAPLTTFDLFTADGSQIPIEERDGEEVRRFRRSRIADPAAPVFNPAFDVVEADLIQGFITDRGLFHTPYRFTEGMTNASGEKVLFREA